MIEGLFQPMHLLLILGIALLFFGPKRLPELGKGLGTSIRDFKDAMSSHNKPEEQQNQQQAQQPAPVLMQAPYQPVPMQQAPPPVAQPVQVQPAPAPDAQSQQNIQPR